MQVFGAGDPPEAHDEIIELKAPLADDGVAPGDVHPRELRADARRIALADAGLAAHVSFDPREESRRLPCMHRQCAAVTPRKRRGGLHAVGGEMREERRLRHGAVLILLLVNPKEEKKPWAGVSWRSPRVRENAQGIVRVDAPRWNSANFLERAEVVLFEEGAGILVRDVRENSHDSVSGLSPYRAGAPRGNGVHIPAHSVLDVERARMVMGPKG